MKKISTETVRIAKDWNQFSSYYSRNIENSTLALFVAMINLADLKAKRKVIDLSMGSGIGTSYLMTRVANETQVIAGDISDEMVGLANERFSSEFNQLNMSLKVSELTSNEIEENAQLVTGVIDNENIPLEAESVDLVVSNLSLMLVNDAEKMLSECHRVLKNGNEALLSIWGNPNNSPLFTFTGQAIKNLNMKLENPPRSNFHLSKDKKYKELIEKAGFKLSSVNIKIPFPFLSLKDLRAFHENQIINYHLSEQFSTEQMEQIYDECERMWKEFLAEGEIPHSEFIILRCFKE